MIIPHPLTFLWKRYVESGNNLEMISKFELVSFILKCQQDPQQEGHDEPKDEDTSAESIHIKAELGQEGKPSSSKPTIVLAERHELPKVRSFDKRVVSHKMNGIVLGTYFGYALYFVFRKGSFLVGRRLLFLRTCLRKSVRPTKQRIMKIFLTSRSK